MIKLYRPPNCPQCANIEETLKELVLAHKVITVTDEADPAADLPPQTPLPALLDEGEIYTGPEAIRQHLEYLEEMAREWRKYQADACYV